MVDGERPELKPDSAEEKRRAPASGINKRIFTDLMKPLKEELDEGWVVVGRKVADFSLYEKLRDVKEAAKEAERGDYTETVGRLIRRGALDAVQAVGIGLFWLAADRIYSEDGAKFLGKMGFPGQVCDLVSGVAQTLEGSGQKQRVIAGAILMKFLRDSERRPQERRMNDTELYLRYGRQRALAFFERVIPERFGKKG